MLLYDLEHVRLVEFARLDRCHARNYGIHGKKRTVQRVEGHVPQADLVTFHFGYWPVRRKDRVRKANVAVIGGRARREHDQRDIHHVGRFTGELINVLAADSLQYILDIVESYLALVDGYYRRIVREYKHRDDEQLVDEYLLREDHLRLPLYQKGYNPLLL